jgi:hypothetical protein
LIGVAWWLWQTAAWVPKPNTTDLRPFLFGAVALFVVVVGVEIHAARWSGPDVPLILVHPVPLNGSPFYSSVVGSLVGSGGDESGLWRIGNQLWVDGVAHAGTFSGKAHAIANVDAADISVSLAVSDWWPYAALTIALGVVVGFLVTRYFKRTRLSDQQRLRIQSTWRDVVTQASRAQQVYGGRSFLAWYNVVPLLQTALSGAASALETSDTIDAAQQSVTQVQAYASAFRRLLGSLQYLDDRYVKVLRDVEMYYAPDFAPNGTDAELLQAVPALSAAHLLLVPAQRFPPDSEDVANQTLLKLRDTQVTSGIAWLEQLAPAMDHLLDGASIQTKAVSWPDADRTRLAGALVDLKGAVSAVLVAVSAEDAKARSSDAAQKFSVLASIKPDSAHTMIRALRRMTIPYPVVNELTAHFGQAVTVFSVTDFSCKIADAPGVAAAPQPSESTRSITADPDDLVEFAATVVTQGASPDKLKLLHWDFGDGSLIVPVEWPDGQANTEMKISTLHQFSTPETFTVTLQTADAQPVGDSCSVTVAEKTGRTDRQHVAFGLSEARMTLISGALVVATGLYLLYFVSPVWGTPGDYLKALLWGSTLSEGVKYAVGLVGRQWPASAA